MVSLLAGALAGAAYGSLIGALKYAVLWRKILKGRSRMSQGSLYRHMGASYAINVASLLLIFLVRDTLPWDFAAVIVAAAVMISIIGKLAPISEIVGRVEENVS